MVKIYEITENKRAYMDLLFLADEQEDMVDQYLEKGTMYLLDDDGIKGECVVTDEGQGILEIKNIATVPEVHGKGYGRLLIDFISREYRESLRSFRGRQPFLITCGLKKPENQP